VKKECEGIKRNISKMLLALHCLGVQADELLSQKSNVRLIEPYVERVLTQPHAERVRSL
jgi:hypothetical protein